MRNKKHAITFIVVLSIVFLVSLLALALMDLIDFDKDGSDKPHIVFYNPDFNSDIMSEPDYLALDRSIKYSDGALTWEISGENYDNPSDSCQAFLINYIKALVAGDTAKVRTMYSDEAIKALGIPEKITEQRIYETVFTELSCAEIVEKGESFFRYEIKAEYKIQKNDGLFRSDLPSDSVKAQILIIDDKAGGAVIKSVVEYDPSKNN